MIVKDVGKTHGNCAFYWLTLRKPILTKITSREVRLFVNYSTDPHEILHTHTWSGVQKRIKDTFYSVNVSEATEEAN